MTVCYMYYKRAGYVCTKKDDVGIDDVFNFGLRVLGLVGYPLPL
jgi:16S rRNA U516 pseudouridylate synthase RsuA-like enzyme